jgi:NAD+ synthase (glutamine-hydrolysing)
MGYCTLYGDMAGGIAVIGDVYKTDVYRLARYRNTVPIPINFLKGEIGAVPTTILEKKQKVGTVKKVIPEAILTKAPSAELRPNQKDQDFLPPYEVLDEILGFYIEKNLSRDEILRKLTRTGGLSAPRHREESLPQKERHGDLLHKRLLPSRLAVARQQRGRNDKSLATLVADVIRKVDHNEYKRRQTPPVLRVTEKAWFGRRMPITNRFFA